jgi:hypothetical protein
MNTNSEYILEFVEQLDTGQCFDISEYSMERCGDYKFCELNETKDALFNLMLVLKGHRPDFELKFSKEKFIKWGEANNLYIQYCYPTESYMIKKLGEQY